MKTVSNYGFMEMRRENRHVRPIAKGIDFRNVCYSEFMAQQIDLD